MNGFKELGLSENILTALENKGFTEPTPIQARTIPLLLSGDSDVVGQAQTGTGKTAAFGLPILERTKSKAGHVQALVLTPTRELALQVSDEINSLRGKKNIRVLPVYGGQHIGSQLKNLKHGVDVVVGTPGRILDHLNRRSLKLDKLSYFVLDEADEMFNMGFIDDVRAIMEMTGQNHRTLLFSATMPREVMRIAKEFMGDYEVVSVKPEKLETSLTNQIFHEMHDSDRFEALCRVIDAHPDFFGLVFCRTKADTDHIADRLTERGYPAEPIHGDITQARREEILSKFRRHKITILVATDVAARGIDVPDLTHVVNFALPQDPETYVHRVGRTGRAGKKGTAVTLIGPYEFRKLMFIAKSTGMDIRKSSLPRIEDVIYSKKTKVMTELNQIIEQDDHSAYMSMARELLEERDPKEVMAALLKQSLGDELDRSSYKEINDNVKPVHQRVTLSAELGRSHGMSPRKFVDFICNRAMIKPFKIQNVKIFGKYTTFTAPARDAEAILRKLNKHPKSGRPLVRRK